jgi:hypothetical protein
MQFHEYYSPADAVRIDPDATLTSPTTDDFADLLLKVTLEGETIVAPEGIVLALDDEANGRTVRLSLGEDGTIHRVGAGGSDETIATVVERPEPATNITVRFQAGTTSDDISRVLRGLEYRPPGAESLPADAIFDRTVSFELSRLPRTRGTYDCKQQIVMRYRPVSDTALPVASRPASASLTRKSK